MTCRRCNGTKNVAHHRNDFFDGWLCVACVDALVNELSDAYVGLPTAISTTTPSPQDRGEG